MNFKTDGRRKGQDRTVKVHLQPGYGRKGRRIQQVNNYRSYQHYPRLTKPLFVSHTVSDGTESMTANGRTDEGRDKTIVSSTFAEYEVLNGIGNISK